MTLGGGQTGPSCLSCVTLGGTGRWARPELAVWPRVASGPLRAGLCLPTSALLGLRDPVSCSEGSETPRASSTPSPGGPGTWGSLGTQVRAVGTAIPPLVSSTREARCKGRDGTLLLGLLPGVTQWGSWPSLIKRKG